MVLVHVYDPNRDSAEFFKNIFSLLPDLNVQYLIFGGDLNCVMDTVLDRSSTKSIGLSKMSQTVTNFMNETGCIDPWRFLFPERRAFSCFSHVHKTYSRTDYFFIDKTLFPYVKNVEYTAIVESDHAPLIPDICFPLNQSERPAWRLNTTLLADGDFCKYISEATDNFLLTNKTDSVSPSLLWKHLKL